MAILSVPDRGQPIDLAYISSMVEAINKLSELVSPTKKSYITIDVPGNRQTTLASGMKVTAAYIQITNTSPTANSEVVFNYSFPDQFKTPPIVTATPYNSGEKVAGNDVTVVVTDISNSGIAGVARFGVGGSLSIGVNIIAVGIPN